MPGRFSLTVDAPKLREAFPWVKGIPDDMRPRYNIAPTQPVAVVLNDGSNEFTFVNWELVPSFSSGAKMTNLLINARSEGITRTPSFRGPFKYKRCLILADGVFEWVKIPRKREKIPYWVHLKSGKPFAFAGLWDSWSSVDGSEIKTCCAITTEPNELVKQIHHRMAVILHEKDYQTWLRPDEADPEELLSLLTAYPQEEMTYYQVSTVVSNARNDVPECVEEIKTSTKANP
ncbi:MAG: SOS response-associated peptidase [Anaerolineales bacterium]